MAKFRRATTNAAPVVVNPSQKFDGDDGDWSSFTIQVGTPPQSFRVLPSTSSSETWVVRPEGCTSSDPSTCPQQRGAEAFNGRASSGFATNASSTWQESGLYSLDLKSSLGLAGNGLYGTDVVGVSGGNGSGGVSVKGQVVAGIATKDYFMGLLGLSSRPTSFSSSASSSPSFLTTLKTDNLIPSLSFGYTAGAQYQGKGVFGNLVLGGYDRSRFKSPAKSFTFASDNAKPLTVGVQSMTASDTPIGVASFTSSGGHLSLIDSSVPELWLPRAVCDSMATALGLNFDNNTGLYTVNNTMRAQLRSLNPKFIFKLGDTAFDNGNSTNIVLPYSAFDKSVGWPIYTQSVNYFPIRRADNSSQYTLGRTLLQEAYLVVDYERKNFSLAQATFSDPMPSANIAIISAASSSSSDSSSSISGGAIAGIVVGVIALVGLVVGLLFFCLRRRKRATRDRLAELDGKEGGAATDSSDAKDKSNYYSGPPEGYAEAAADNQISEMGGAENQHSVDHKLNPHAFTSELDNATHHTTSELPTPQPVFEMMGDSEYTGSRKVAPAEMGAESRPAPPTAAERSPLLHDGPSPVSAGLAAGSPHHAAGVSPSVSPAPRSPGRVGGFGVDGAGAR